MNGARGYVPRAPFLRNIRQQTYLAASIASLLVLLATPIDAAETSGVALDREPCVTVSFASGWQIDATGHRQRVVATATLRDGRQLEGPFPYDWTYANPSHDNRFFGANGFRSDLPLRVQRPPRPLDPRTVSPVITYVLAHTDKDGRFHGRACPPPATPDQTIFERLSGNLIPKRVSHIVADDLVLQIALSHKGEGPITACALALNVGTRPVERVRLRWDFKLRSGTVTTPQDWRVSLSPFTMTQDRDALDNGLTEMASNGTMSCAPITNDPRLKSRLDQIEQISVTVLSVERTFSQRRFRTNGVSRRSFR